MKLTISTFFLFFSLLAQSQGAFQEGEWLSFKIKYGWFNTSKASLEINSTQYNGQDVYQIIGSGRTVGVLDVFFKVRDHYETFVTKDQNLPLKFIRDINEGGHTKNKELFFNHQTQTVKVVDHKHTTEKTFPFQPNTQDMLSALYKLRNTIDTKHLKKGQEFNLNMFFDDENYNFKTIYLGSEIINTKFGKVECLKFRPYVMAERVFEESESLTFWVTADQNKIPIKIEAQLAVGSLTAELNEFKGLKHPFKVIVE